MDLGGAPLNLRPRYNAAPGQDIAVVRAGDSGSQARPPGSEAGTGFRGAASTGRNLAMLRWGLIPSWAREPTIAWKLINARSETAAEADGALRGFEAPLPPFYTEARRPALRRNAGSSVRGRPSRLAAGLRDA